MSLAETRDFVWDLRAARKSSFYWGDPVNLRATRKFTGHWSPYMHHTAYSTPSSPGTSPSGKNHTTWSEKLEHALQWRHNGHDAFSNHQPHDCLLSRLFRHRTKKTSKLRVTGLCAGNSPGTGEFPTQRASYAENVSIWWRHHVIFFTKIYDNL